MIRQLSHIERGLLIKIEQTLKINKYIKRFLFLSMLQRFFSKNILHLLRNGNDDKLFSAAIA